MGEPEKDRQTHRQKKKEENGEAREGQTLTKKKRHCQRKRMGMPERYRDVRRRGEKEDGLGG